MPPVTDPSLLSALEGQAAATPPMGPGFIPGRAKTPAAQTPEQAEATRLGNIHTQQEIDSQPLSDEAKRTTIVNAATDNEAKLRSEFHLLPTVREFVSALPKFAAATRAGDNPVGDMQIITAWVKTYDPTGAVMTGDITTAEQAQSAYQKMTGQAQSLFDGSGRLKSDVRQNFLRETHTRLQSLADAYRQERQNYEHIAGRTPGVNPLNVIGDPFQEQFQQAEAAYLGRPIRKFGEEPKEVKPLADVENTVNALSDDGENGLRVDITDDRLPGETDEQYAARIKRGEFSSSPNANTPLAVKRGEGGFAEKADAFVRGVADVPTFGLADEIAAGAKTIFSGGTMAQNLRSERAVDDYDEKNNWGTRFLGQLAGGASTGLGGMAKWYPTGNLRTISGMAKTGGAYGGLYGLGSGRGDMLDRLRSGAEEGVAGLATGGALGIAGKGVGKGWRAFFGPKTSEVPPLVGPDGRLNEPLEAMSPAQRYAAAQEHGIDLPIGAAGDRSAAIIEKGLDNLPASAGEMSDTRRVLQQQVVGGKDGLGGLEGVASRYGEAAGPHAGGEAAQREARNWIDRATGAKGDPADRGVVGKAYDAIGIPDDADTALGNSARALEELTSKFPSNDQLATVFHNPRLAKYLDAVKEGMDWKDLKEFRSRIGEQIGEQRFSDDPSKSELRALYAALSEDMRASAAQYGPKALRAFERANSLNRNVETRIESALVRILGDDGMKSPEAAAAALMTIAQSGKGSANIKQLADIRASMAKGRQSEPGAGWNEIAAAALRLMGQPARAEGRAFSPQTFIDNYSSMSEPARNLFFSDKGRAPLREALDSFVAVNQRLVNTNALRNNSNTAPVMGGMNAVQQAGSGIIGGVTLVNPLLGLKLAGLAGVNYGIGKLWTSPKFVRWATGYTKLLAEKANPEALDKEFGRLRKMAVLDPTLREPVENLLGALFSANGDPSVPPTSAPAR